MPVYCAALGCSNRRSAHTKTQGITFHKFPTDKELRCQWEAALQRDRFSANESSKLCSEHFRPEDFDRTGQTVRLRDGAKPTIFSFQTHHQKPVKTRTTQVSKKAAESLPVVPVPVHIPKTKAEPLVIVDHSYALPESPSALKARLGEALARVETLERQVRNFKDRERRAKRTVRGLLNELKGKNIINEELKERLDLYSDLPIELLSKQGHEYTESQREFALTLHLHGPKAYSYLRESLHLNLPHPHTLQRWTSLAST